MLPPTLQTHHSTGMPMINLHEDILWRVFMMNADLNAPQCDGRDPVNWSPLTIARRTSQVCQSWRRVLLGSPSIWGRMIHLDYLGQKHNTWKHEVLRRTGDAPLCIRGVSVSLNAELFFFYILRAEWPRIREIDVKINNPWPDEVWQPLLRPNSTLESFHLNRLRFNSSILLCSEDKLFSDSAPSLREFSFPSIRLSLNAPWFAHIQYITISHKYPLPEILLSMKCMECLAYIQIEHGFETQYHQKTAISLPQLSLPRLLHIHLRGEPSACFQFLECITPARGCGLWLALRDLITSKEELNKYHKTFNRFMHNYFTLSSPEHFVLGIHSHFFTLADLEQISPFGSFDIGFCYESPLSSLVESLFLRSLRESQFVSSLKVLRLAEPEFEEAYSLNFIEFIQSLSALDTLQITSMHILDLLRRIPDSLTVSFPTLNTIQILDYVHVSPAAIHRFILWRIKCNHPISLLDLTSCQSNLNKNFGILETFRGLEVMWLGQSSTEIYTCGTGHPERLNFGR